MKIGIVCSGGDAPGMNPCIASIYKYASRHRLEVVCIRGGFPGILRKHTVEIPQDVLPGLYKMGGTVIKTGRLPELKEESVQREIIIQLKKMNIKALIVLGGDGSFKGAMMLNRLESGINFIGIPCTIDNNIYGSEYTLGYDTALNKLVSYIDDITDTAMALPGRVFLVETLGAWEGYFAYGAYEMGMADFCIICECPITDEELLKIVETFMMTNGKGFVLVTIAEGVGNIKHYYDLIKNRLGYNVKMNMIGYQQRGGVPTALERIHAANFARMAVEACLNDISGKYIAYTEQQYRYIDLEDARKKKDFTGKVYRF